MAKQIVYFEIERQLYEDYDWKRKDVSDYLKNYQIINIETLEKVIRFWYNEEE